jgi:uncharacterized protein YegP (UPF0339 family)
MPEHFEIYKAKSGGFRWRLIHTNGIVIANSGGGYTTKVNAVKDLWDVLSIINKR